MEDFQEEYLLERRKRNDDIFQVDENVIAGIVGSFLYSLVGAVLWFLIYQLGFIAAIAGLITVICATKGYVSFSKKLSIKGAVISVLMSAFMILVAEWACLGYEIYQNYKLEYNITIFDAFRSIPDFLKDEAVMKGVTKDLVMGYGFALLGSFSYVKNLVSALHKEKSIREA